MWFSGRRSNKEEMSHRKPRKMRVFEWERLIEKSHHKGNWQKIESSPLAKYNEFFLLKYIKYAYL